MDHLIDDSNRLKPCPFCGAEAEIITLEGETDDQSIGAQCVQCTSSACGAASGLIYPLMDDVTDLLRERWNKRHNQYDTADEINRMRELADSEGTRAVEYLRRARKSEANVARLMLEEEGAKDAFAHVVQQKHDADAECKRLRGLLDAAHADIRRMSKTPNA